MDWAWIHFTDSDGREIVYYSGFPQEKPQGCPSSAVVKLLQGIFDQKWDLSFFILRNRVHVNHEPSKMDLGIIRLVAKRWGRVSPQAVTDSKEGRSMKDRLATVQWIEIGDSSKFFYETQVQSVSATLQVTRIEDPNQALDELEQQIPRGNVFHDHPRMIAAILTDQDGNVLGYSVHRGWLNKTLHAEVQLLQGYFQKTGKTLPEGAKIYTSLKPCRMCAEMIRQMAGRDFEVRYKQNDPGPMAQGSSIESRMREL